MSLEGEFDKNTLGFTILIQLNKLDDYLFRMFNTSDNVGSNPKYEVQALGYMLMIESLEKKMYPVLAGDSSYSEEVGQLELPVSCVNEPHAAANFILKWNEKLQVIAKRFYRFGLVPQLPTTLNMITRNQKYEKFRERIKAQAVKMIDLYGSELVEEVRKRRENKAKRIEEMKETEYSEIYREYLAQAKTPFESLEDSVSDYVEG